MGQFSDLERMYHAIMQVQAAVAEQKPNGWACRLNLHAHDILLCEQKTAWLVGAAISELCELKDSFNWKIHKEWRESQIDRANIRVEVVDTLHYLLEIAINWGITPAMLVEDFEKKYNRIPSQYAAQSYDAALLLDSAIAKVKGNVGDKKAFQAALKAADFKSVRGNFKFNTNGFPIQDQYIFEVTKDAKGRVSLKTVATPLVIVDSRTAFATASVMSCASP